MPGGTPTGTAHPFRVTAGARERWRRARLSATLADPEAGFARVFEIWINDGLSH